MKGLKWFDKLIYILNALLAFALLLSYILPYLPPKTFAILSVLSLGVPLLIVVNVVFLFYWLVKLKKQMFLSLSVLLVGYFFLGGLYKISSEEEVTSSDLSVMNYNVRLFNVYEWIPRKGVEKDIESFIKDKSPDILSIQEYHPHKSIDLSFYKYKFENVSGQRVKYGQVIFSKYAIINSGSIEFPNTFNNAIYADVVKGKDTVRIYNLHLQSLGIDPNIDHLKKEDSEKLFGHVGNTFKMQQSQAELFLKHKASCPYKMIVCGDFNNTAFSYVYRNIKGDLKDAFTEEGNGFGRTYNFKFFPIRIDFILNDQSIEVESFKTFDENYSDHYPIMARLKLGE